MAHEAIAVEAANPASTATKTVLMTGLRERFRKLLIGVLLVGISLLHFSPLAGFLGTHLVHRELYFFPILLAGFWFGFKGGLITATAVCLIYTSEFIFSGVIHDVFVPVAFQDMVFLFVGIFLGGMVDLEKRRSKERDRIHRHLMEDRMQQRAMRIQMETAAKIQSLFRPKLPELGSGSRVWAFSRPAKFVGGDLYDIIPMKDGSWLMYVADVSDKGLPAALIMAALWYRIRSDAHMHEDVGQLVTALNRPLYDLLSEEGYFATIFICRYWPENGRLLFVNGGHPPAIKMLSDGFELVNGLRGMPLGVLADSIYEAQATTLGANEAFILMTDGITEAAELTNTHLGLKRIHRLLRKNQGPPWGGNLLDDLRHDDAHGQCDDATVLEIWRGSGSRLQAQDGT